MNSKDGQRCKYRAGATERRRNGCRTYRVAKRERYCNEARSIRNIEYS